jgi:hypothetical protein
VPQYICTETLHTNFAEQPLIPAVEQWGPITPQSAKLTQRFAISLNEVRFDRTTFRLKRALCVLLSEDEAEEGMWVCEDAQHTITSFGDSRETALHSFCEDFAVLWDVIGNSSDDDLTSDARKVKGFMISTVDAVIVE